MRITARRKIIEYVARHPGADAAQIARALGSTRPAVRHHLAILKADGRVKSTAAPSPGARGRPRLTYGLSETLVGNNLAMLAEHLLTAWTRHSPQGPDRPGMVSILSNLLSEHIRSPAVDRTAAKKLAALVERLDQLHYEARWEAGPEGPRLMFGHCPYAAVIDGHPELCSMDADAISAVLDAEVEQKSKIDPSGRGAPNCVFQIRNR